MIEWTDDGWRLRPPGVFSDQRWPLTADTPTAWAKAGWYAADSDDRHYSLAIRDLFPVDRRPSRDELDWFRLGFAEQRAGGRPPADRGSFAPITQEG